MRNTFVIAALLASVAGPALATSDHSCQGNSCNIDNSTTNRGGTGVGIGIGKGGNARATSSNRLTTKQLNEQSLSSQQSARTGNQNTNVDASSSDRTNIPVGAAISLSYAPNANPEASIDAAARTVVTNTSYHFLDPLWGHAYQEVQPTVEFSFFLAVKSYEFSNEGYAATAILCDKEPGVAKQLRRACE